MTCYYFYSETLPNTWVHRKRLVEGRYPAWHTYQTHWPKLHSSLSTTYGPDTIHWCYCVFFGFPMYSKSTVNFLPNPSKFPFCDNRATKTPKIYIYHKENLLSTGFVELETCRWCHQFYKLDEQHAGWHEGLSSLKMSVFQKIYSKWGKNNEHGLLISKRFIKMKQK